MADISQIKLPNNTTYDLKDSKKTGIYYVKGTQTAATGAWTGNIDVPALYTGLTIMYYLPYNGSGNATLNLTLSDGTTTGAKNCYVTTGRLTTHYGAGRNIIMTYYKAGDISVSGTATTDDRWICDAFYDTNDTAYYLRRSQTNILAGPNKIFPYTIIMQTADGRWESIVTSSSTATTKSRNTHGFRLGQILFMYANAIYNENVRVANNNIWDHHSGANDHRYSFNTANNATNGTIANKPIYIVGTLNATDGLFYLDVTWWTQTLPSSDDGKLYIYIGDALDHYRFDYAVNHPIYWFKNGAVRLFTQDAATVTGHTVAKDVPSNAVFTDHTYSGTGLISVNSSGVISTTATANTGTITSVKTTAGAHTAINVTSGAANFNVPTKTSHLTNDSGFVTSDTKVNQNLDSSNQDRPLILAGTTISDTNSSVNGIVARNNNIYANPYTGDIYAGASNGITNDNKLITGADFHNNYATDNDTNTLYHMVFKKQSAGEINDELYETVLDDANHKKLTYNPYFQNLTTNLINGFKFSKFGGKQYLRLFDIRVPKTSAYKDSYFDFLIAVRSCLFYVSLGVNSSGHPAIVHFSLLAGSGASFVTSTGSLTESHFGEMHYFRFNSSGNLRWTGVSAILLNNYCSVENVKDIHMSMYIGEDNKPQSWVNDYDIWYGANQ